MQILLVGGFHIADGNTEPGHQGEFLLHGIGAVEFIIAVCPVGPGLTDQVAAVGCCIDQHILGLGLKTAFDDRLEIFVLNLEFFEREIIHINNKAVVAVLDFGQDPLQITKLVFIDLDHAKAPVIILVQDRLDTGGLACACISVEENIVGRASADEGLGIGDEFFLLQFIADEVIEDHVAGRRDGNEEIVLSRCSVVHRPCCGAGSGHSRKGSRSSRSSLTRCVNGVAPPLIDAEGLVETEHTYAVILIKIGHDPVHIFFICCLFEFSAQCLHFFGDAVIVDPLLLADRAIVFDHRKDVHIQRFFQRRKVVVKELFENPQIIFDKVIDRALIGARLLGDQGERRLCHGEKKGQIIVPQIVVESVARRQVQQSVDLVENTSRQGLFVINTLVKFSAHL